MRGRWSDPSGILVRVDDEDGLAEAARRALDAWERSGVVGFRWANREDVADLELAWRKDSEDECGGFGPGHASAHAGPARPGTFVHFDAGRDWSGDELARVAVHEVGHVLGLGHGDAPDSILQPDPPRSVIEPGPTDFAALHSLYGGGEDGPADLWVRRGGATLLILRRVAPAGRTDFALFDTDGDGKDDLVVWRTDREGQGTVLVYRFEHGPRLAATQGPRYGMTVPGATVRLAETADAKRVLVTLGGGGDVAFARSFADGTDAGPVSDHARVSFESTPLVRAGDLDGDGVLEEVSRGE